MPSKNPNSILFLYEGDTEFEFYSKIIDLYLPKRRIRFDYSNLRGVHNLNKKVKNKILNYLVEKPDTKHMHVLVAHDREGRRSKESQLNLELLLRDSEIISSGRVQNILEIIATQDIESWFFKDYIGIYKFLRVPKKNRSNKYKNSEGYNNKDLSKLFHQQRKHYQKGSRVDGFINSLDITKIYNQTPELQNAINYMLKLLN